MHLKVLQLAQMAVVSSLLIAGATGSAQAQVRALLKWQDPRAEFVRLCMSHMVGRWAHPDAVCGCLHDHALSRVEDPDMREALLQGISETGVPNIERDRIPASKQSQIASTFDQIAKPTLQCMFAPLEE
jgi:hypothetical protein